MLGSNHLPVYLGGVGLMLRRVPHQGGLVGMIQIWGNQAHRISRVDQSQMRLAPTSPRSTLSLLVPGPTDEISSIRHRTSISDNPILLVALFCLCTSDLARRGRQLIIDSGRFPCQLRMTKGYIVACMMYTRLSSSVRWWFVGFLPEWQGCPG